MELASNPEFQPVSVAVVNYNGSHFLAETIDSIMLHCQRVIEIIVVDNASTDDSRELIEHDYSHVRLLKRASSVGPGQARNLAIASARADLVLLLDNDVAPCADCLPRLIEALHRYPSAVLAMPSILYHDRPDTTQFCGAEAHFMGSVAPLSCQMRFDATKRDITACTSMISAAFLVNRKTLGHHVLFNNSLFIYQEDHEAGYRGVSAGFQLLRVPGAACLHREGTMGLSIRVSGQVHATRVRQTLFNRWYVLVTLYQGSSLLRYLPALFIHEIIVFAGLIVQRRVSDWSWAIKELNSRRHSISEQRKQVQTNRVVDDAAILRGGPFPFNEETPNSLLQTAGQALSNFVSKANWGIAKPRFRSTKTEVGHH